MTTRTTSRDSAERAAAPTRRHANRRRGPVPARYYALLTVIVVLNFVGLVMVLSASSVEALYDYGSSWWFFNRRLMWSVIGVAALVICHRIDYRAWRRFVPILLGASGVLLGLVLVPSLGVTVNGSQSWLGLGAFRMQPSELAKLALLVYTADVLSKRSDRMHDLGLTLRPVIVMLVATCGLIMLQPDLGTAIVLVAIVLSLCYVAGTPLLPLSMLTVAMAVVGAGFVLSEAYRRNRFLAFLDPSADPQGIGYQTMQSLVGLASGGVSGTGLGEGRAKWGFLPEAHTDFIFSVIGEELGLVGCVLVVALFAAFGLLGVRVALRAPDRFSMLLAGGITAWVLVQAFINMGAVVGLLPITGLPMPFVSFGGSSLIVSMAACGILLDIARRGRPAPARRPATAAGGRARR